MLHDNYNLVRARERQPTEILKSFLGVVPSDRNPGRAGLVAASDCPFPCRSQLTALRGEKGVYFCAELCRAFRGLHMMPLYRLCTCASCACPQLSSPLSGLSGIELGDLTGPVCPLFPRFSVLRAHLEAGWSGNPSSEPLIIVKLTLYVQWEMPRVLPPSRAVMFRDSHMCREP